MAQNKTAQRTPKLGLPIAHAVGRRKCSVARAWLRKGTGKITVNGIDYVDYFDTQISRTNAASAFAVCPLSSNFDVQINVNGGGKKGQSDAVKLAISRAFLEQDASLRPALKKEKLLRVDDRNKERKKYGQRGARRKFQFVKR